MYQSRDSEIIICANPVESVSHSNYEHISTNVLSIEHPFHPRTLFQAPAELCFISLSNSIIVKARPLTRHCKLNQRYDFITLAL